MKSVRNLVLISAALIILCLCACSGINIRLSQDDIREKLDARFPIKKTYLLIFETSFKHPRVSLQKNSDRISIGLDATLSIPLESNTTLLKGSLDVSAAVKYNAETKQLILIDSEITKLTIDGIPETYSEKVQQIAKIAVREYLDEVPIYTLREKKFGISTARLLIKETKIEDGFLIVKLGLN